VKTSTDRMGKLGTEIARLEERRSALGAEVERAAERLKELSARRDAFAPGASAGDKGAAGSFAALVAALEEEYASVLRTKALAEEAARELDRLILEAEVRHREEEKRLARRRYEALCKERYSLGGEAEEAMARLVEVLDRLDSLHADQVRTADDAEDHSPAQQDLGAITEHWLARRLRRWLPNGSFEKYDASLPELDPLALKPEPDEG
jgi:chromosome segregation ATPase